MNVVIRKALFGTAAAVTLGSACLPAFALSAPIPIESSRLASQIIKEANRYRQSEGAAPVVANESLTRAAQRYAEYLARTMKTGHAADGKAPRQRVASVGYKACSWGESLFEPNPYEGSGNPRGAAERVVTYWKPFPGSNRNLVNPRLKHVGVGVAAWSHGPDAHFFKVVYLVAGACQ